MTLPRAIVVAAVLIAGAIIWRGEAQSQSAKSRDIKAVVSGELIWWLESTPAGPSVSVCGFDGRKIDCRHRPIDE